MASLAAPMGITGVSLLWAGLRSFQAWDELPAVMASHYSASGAVNSTTSKGEFFLFFGLMVALVIGSLVGSAFLMKKLPTKHLNLPHKEYWLDGRMGEARRRMTSGLWWMTAATTVLCAFVLELVISANVHRRGLNGDAMWLILGAYFVFSIVWTIKFLTAFTPPKNET